MKRILLATVIATSSFAYADSGLYTSLKAGVSDTKFEDYKLDLSEGNESLVYKHKDADETIYPNISAAIGFDFSKVSKVNARAELEYTYKDKATFAPNISSAIFDGEEVKQYFLTEKDMAEINKIRDERYATWEWNYGFSPQYSIQKERRFPNVGKIEVYMEVENGRITEFDVAGDYFGNGNKEDLQKLLIGKQVKADAIAEAIQPCPAGSK